LTAARASRVAAVAFAAVALLGACAGPAGPPAAPSGASPAATAASLPDPIRLTGVPFVAQPDWQCGPASLAMALVAAGREVPVARLAERAFVPGLQGALQAEMLAATRAQGMLATELPPSLDALRAELADGWPVVVLQNLGLAFAPRWHYALLTGVDLAAREVVLHSGDTPSLAMPLDTFERTWARGGRWAFAVTPPHRMAAAAEEAAAVRAVAGLERVDATAAGRAWEALVTRWPHSRLGWFGRGNRLLADGDPRGAIGAYRAALAADPGFADAWNNLARALEASGRLDAARLAADRAVSIGGPRADAYRDTRASLDGR
jgi:tetratricopeptide (TPR) repeat protein